MNIFKWSLSLLFLALIVFACEKDQFPPDLSDDNNQDRQLISGIDANLPETPAYKLKKELAIGLSSAVSKYPEMLELFKVKQQQKNTTNRLPALTLINNLDRQANSQGGTLADVLLENATELRALYRDINGLKEEIQKVDPLISFKIPSIWYDYDFIGAKSQPVVHAFESKELQSAFVNGHSVKLEKGKNYFAINVQTSEEHMLVEMDKDPGDQSIFSYMFACTHVQDHMTELVQEPNLLIDIDDPNSDDPIIIVDIFDDVRDVFTQSCNTLAPPSFLSVMECELDCKRDCGREDNRLMGFELSSMTALNEMGTNAPSGQMEEFFNFHINFVNADRESPIANRVSYYYTFSLNDLVGTITTVSEGQERCEQVWNSHWQEWDEYCWIPTFITSDNELKYVPLNGEIGIPLTGFWNAVQNEWDFERYGDAMKISWQEVDNTFYNLQTGVAENTQQSFQFGISVNAGFKAIGATMSSNASFSHSNSSQTSLSISAASLVQLGDQLVGFCDEPNEDFDINYNSGMIKSHLVYFLPE